LLSIGGDVVGSSGLGSGLIYDNGNNGSIGTLKIGGALKGGSGDYSGEIWLTKIGSLQIGGSLIGSTGADSGFVKVSKIGPVSVGGDLKGGAGVDSGSIQASVSLGNTKIGGSLIGGSGVKSGFLSSGAITGVSTGTGPSISIGGGIIGGSDEYAGTLSGSAFSSISVHDSLTGGTGVRSGAILASSVGSITLGGSIVGGSGVNNGSTPNDGLLGVSGAIMVTGSLGNLKIAGDVTGAGSSTTDISKTGFISANHIGTLAIGGSLVAGAKGNSSLTDSGAIRVGRDIGSLSIGGDLRGNATNPAIVSAGGFRFLSSSAKTDVAINRVIIGGDMTRAAILAGYTDGTATSWGTESDPHAQINSVIINGNLTASSIAAGVSAGTDQAFGTGDDKALDGPLIDFSRIISTISSVVVRGHVLAENPEPMGNFGIVSKHVVAVSIAGQPEPLIDGPQNDTNYLALGDPAASTSIREIAPESSPSL
jgi:hypothetical protein